MPEPPEKRSCPDCPGFQPIYTGIEACRVCGLARTAGALRGPEDQDYLGDGNWGGQLRPDYFSDIYSRYFKTLLAGNSLDIGCGRGELVEKLCKHGWNAHGIDSYEGFQEDRVRYFKTSLDSFVTGEVYDLISLIHSFEHLGDPIGSLQRIASILAPNGVVFIVVPNFGGVWARLLGDRWHMLRPEDHAYHYTSDGLSNILQRCGFLVQGIRTYSGYAPSSWQIRLAENRFYESGIGRIPILRSIIFRANTILQPHVNRVIDFRKQGAEIQLLASRSN